LPKVGPRTLGHIREPGRDHCPLAFGQVPPLEILGDHEGKRVPALELPKPRRYVESRTGPVAVPAVQNSTSKEGNRFMLSVPPDVLTKRAKFSRAHFGEKAGKPMSA